MPTIRDVAKNAGVSTRTVNRVLHGEIYVSAEVRQRVRESLASLQYAPNKMAQSMVTGRSGIVALSLSSVTSPLVAPIIKGAMDQARRLGLHLVLCETGEKRTAELEYLILTRSGLVDGVILASHVVAPGIPAGLDQLKAICLINYDLPGVAVPQFIQDCAADTYLLTHHLFAAGARRIAFLSGPAERRSSQQKLDGFRRAHLDIGTAVDENCIFYSEYTVPGGRAAMSHLLAAGCPDAIFAGNDLIALGAMQVARENGLAIPEKLIICGFDDHPYSEYADPPLTTVRPNMYGMGVMAVNSIVQQIARVNEAERADDIGLARRVLVPGELVVRASTGGGTGSCHTLAAST